MALYLERKRAASFTLPPVTLPFAQANNSSVNDGSVNMTSRLHRFAGRLSEKKAKTYYLHD